MILKPIIAIAALAVAASACAQFYDGNKLLSRLQSRGNNPNDYLSALNYVMGVTDALDGVAFCAPDGVTAGQVTDMVQRHLETVPSARHFAADVHIAYVLKKVWPCPEGRGKGKSNGNNTL